MPKGRKKGYEHLKYHNLKGESQCQRLEQM